MKWVVFAFALLCAVGVLNSADPPRAYAQASLWLTVVLVFSISLSATNSFRADRESGALELLLVSPLTEGQIIGGRLRGIWSQYLPAVAVWLGLWMTLNSLGLSTHHHLLPGAGFVPLYFFAALPVIGLHASLRLDHTLLAVVKTLSLGVVLPVVVASAVRVMSPPPFGALAPGRPLSVMLDVWGGLSPGGFLFTLGGVTWYCWNGLARDLRMRNFHWQRNSG